MKHPELPFSSRKLKVNKIEFNVISTSFRKAARSARHKAGIPKGFYLHGVIKTGDNETL